MKTKNIFKKIAFLAIGLFAFNVQANNVQIMDTSVDTVGGTITFNIKWDNSWRTDIAPANHDAVWVFIKYQDCADRLWKHANLSTVSADHSAGGTILQVDAVSDGKGVFIYRNANGGGNIAFTSVTLKLNVASPNYDNYNFKVFGIEMVNIPQGNFWIGDGASTNTFTQYQVTSETTALTTSTIGAGNTAPAAFPKGWKSFYSMKYEITQEQYVEFLNSLTYGQQARRTAKSPDSPVGTYAFDNYYRNGVIIKTPGVNGALPAVYGCDLTVGDINDLNDGQNIAMNQLSFADVSAYLDWSALRPMTEIEFEKICRGPLTPVANEYAWGSIDLNPILPAGVVNAGQPNEGYNSVANGRANYGATNNYGQPFYYYAPVKVGFTATNASGRLSASAAYYGVMEMSGNVPEMTVIAKTTGNGSSYTGVLGDGELSTVTATDGDANQTNWPNFDGILIRGGHYYAAPNTNTSTLLRTSDRSGGAPTSNRANFYGGRGVR